MTFTQNIFISFESRLATVMLYLTTPQAGGFTTFPQLSIAVPPVKVLMIITMIIMLPNLMIIMIITMIIIMIIKKLILVQGSALAWFTLNTLGRPDRLLDIILSINITQV